MFPILTEEQAAVVDRLVATETPAIVAFRRLEFPIVGKHLPQQHDQRKHGRPAMATVAMAEPPAAAAAVAKVIRTDTQADWDKVGARRPTDEELQAAYGLDGIQTEISVYTKNINGEDRLFVDVNAQVSQAIPGAQIRVMRRVFAKVTVPTVLHSNFELPTAFQQSGIGSKMLERSEALYRKIGIERIILTANSSVGKYAWARMGFDFAGADDRRITVDRFYNYLSYHGVPPNMWPETVSHPWEIAAWKPPKPGNFSPSISGKDFLLAEAPSYEAAKNLNDDDIGYQIGQAYYAEKNKHS